MVTRRGFLKGAGAAAVAGAAALGVPFAAQAQTQGAFNAHDWARFLRNRPFSEWEQATKQLSPEQKSQVTVRLRQNIDAFEKRVLQDMESSIRDKQAGRLISSPRTFTHYNDIKEGHPYFPFRQFYASFAEQLENAPADKIDSLKGGYVQGLKELREGLVGKVEQHLGAKAPDHRPALQEINDNVCQAPSGQGFGNDLQAKGFFYRNMGDASSWNDAMKFVGKMSDYQQSWIGTVAFGRIATFFVNLESNPSAALPELNRTLQAGNNFINQVNLDRTYTDVLNAAELNRKPSAYQISEAVAAAKADPAIDDRFRTILVRGLELSSWNYITSHMALKQAALVEDVAPRTAYALRARILGGDGYEGHMDNVNHRLACDGKLSNTGSGPVISL